MRVYCLTGMPLVGKTTIGKRLAEKLGVGFFSSGEFARSVGFGPDEPKNDPFGTALSVESKLRAHIAANIERFGVLDGFPRTPSQYLFLRDLAEPVLLFFKADVELIAQRAKMRNRDDDLFFEVRINQALLFEQALLYMGVQFHCVSTWEEVCRVCGV